MRPGLRPIAAAAAVAVASAVAWLELAGAPVAARAWAVVLLVPLPILLILQGRALSGLEKLPRTESYISSIVSLWALAFATLAVARVSGYGSGELGLVSPGPSRTALLASAMTIGGVAVLFAFRFAGVREPQLVRDLMPVSTHDRILFTGVSITAGICEEIVFRGFLIHVLYGATGSLVIALLLSSGVFGVAHAYQQPAGAVRAALLGLILSLPLVVHGSIVPSIIAHAAIDLLSGLWLARYLLR